MSANDWKEWLTEKEHRDVQALDIQIKLLRLDRQHIRNRAKQRRHRKNYCDKE